MQISLLKYDKIKKQDNQVHAVLIVVFIRKNVFSEENSVCYTIVGKFTLALFI